MEKHVMSIMVNNDPGVLTRISRLFGARGYNIESLTVGRTKNKDESRITVVMNCDNQMLEQIMKQTAKLYDVRGVEELAPKESVYREIALVKVAANHAQRSAIREIAEIFRASIIDLGLENLIIEITGDGDKVDAFLRVIEPYGILEMTRTGLTALGRGVETLIDHSRAYPAAELPDVV